MEVGYIRVSSVDQNTDRQLEDISLEKTFTDKLSGKNTDRPALQQCLEFIREGDVLHVHSIDRLARNLEDLLSLIKRINGKGVAVWFHKENLQFTGDDSPMQQLHLQILGAVAQFERSLIKERQREGIAIAKAKGKYHGGKKQHTEAEIESIIFEARTSQNVAATARRHGIHRNTLYKWLKGAGSN